MAGVEQLHLSLCVLQAPVQIVQLDLAEFHMFAIRVQEPFHDRDAAMGREAEMADAPGFLLLEQMVQDAIFLIQISIDVQFAHIVEQVEIKVFALASFQLPREDLLHLRHVGQIISGKLAGEMISIPRISGQDLSHHALRIAAVVAPGSVEVIDAVCHGVSGHAGRLFFIDLAVSALQRQTHAAHAQRGQLQVLKCLISHRIFSFPSRRMRVFSFILSSCLRNAHALWRCPVQGLSSETEKR